MFGKNTFDFSKTLNPHPSDPADLAPISAKISRNHDSIICEYILPANEAYIESPNQENLWEGSCLELFLKYGERYWEWNVSLSGKTQLYCFDGWRNRIGKHGKQANGIHHFNHNGSTYSFTLRLSPALPMLHSIFQHSTHSIECKMACILVTSSWKGHWTNQHPIGAPNFHSSNGFQKLVL